MEVIAFILMIVFALISASEKKKKAAKRDGNPEATMRPQANGRPQAGRPVSEMSLAEREARLNELRQNRSQRAAEAASAPVMPSNARQTFESSLSELKELLNVAVQPDSRQGASMLKDEVCAGGSMPHSHVEGSGALSDEECAGGSMAHIHSEGESRAEQRRRLSDMDRKREAEEADRLVPGTIDARALRRAVVMAEVLGKPKGLQRPRNVA